jgi:hypothetical protein
MTVHKLGSLTSGIWIFLALAATVLLFFAIRNLNDRRVARSSSRWPLLTGDVRSARQSGSGRGDYEVTIAYDYRHAEEDQPQSGEFLVPFTTHAQAQDFAARIQAAGTVNIRYDPTDATRFAILLSDN